MITITTQGSSIILKIESGYPIGNYIHTFEHSCSAEFIAKLLADNISEHLDEMIRNIRKEEYNKGYDDKKQRKPKKEWFSRVIQEGRA